MLKSTLRSRRSSSVGESTRLISAGSAVRIRPPALISLSRVRRLMRLVDRVRRTIRDHGLRRARHPRRRRRCRAGPTRWPRPTCSGELHAGRRARARRPRRISTTSCGPPLGGRRALLPVSWLMPSAGLSSWTALTCALGRARSTVQLKMPRGGCGTRSSSGRASHFGADRVAVGHTRDDQAETFLLRLLRGAGPRGLGGDASAARTPVVRPLLECRRQALREYLAATWALPSFTTHRTTTSTHSAQSRPRGAAAAARAAVQSGDCRARWRRGRRGARGVAVDFKSVAEAAGAERAGSEGRRWTIDAVGLTRLAARGRSRRRAAVMVEAAGGRAIRSARRGRQARWHGLAARPIQGPRPRVDRAGDSVVLTGRDPTERGRPTRRGRLGRIHRAPVLGIRCLFQGEAERPAVGLIVSRRDSARQATDWRAVPGTGRIRRRSGGRVARAALAVRGRAVPATGSGRSAWRQRKKLQDFFVDRKVPRAARDQVPARRR